LKHHEGRGDLAAALQASFTGQIGQKFRFLEKPRFKKILEVNGLPDYGIWSFRIRLLASVASG
jgi:hypothetical protein